MQAHFLDGSRVCCLGILELQYRVNVGHAHVLDKIGKLDEFLRVKRG